MSVPGDVLWMCRRGMLELDLMLQPFVAQEYMRCSDAQKQDFSRLLNCQDTELQLWFYTDARPSCEGMAAMVELIRSVAFTRGE